MNQSFIKFQILQSAALHKNYAFSYFTPFDGKTRQTDALSTFKYLQQIASFLVLRFSKEKKVVKLTWSIIFTTITQNWSSFDSKIMSNNHDLPNIKNLSYKGKIFNLKSEAMPQSTDGSKWMKITIIVTQGDKIHTVKKEFFGIGDPMADKFIKKSLDAFYNKSKMEIIFSRVVKIVRWCSTDFDNE